MEAEHDSKVAGHMGQDQTIELVRRNIFGQKWRNSSMTMSAHALNAKKTKQLDMLAMDCYNPSNSHTAHGIPFQWISLSNYQYQTDAHRYG
jgi:hypothetical protein